jgi:PBP1b-binding outer membrane lipoprotein LpoB
MRVALVLVGALALAGCVNNELSPEAKANMAQAREAYGLEKPAVSKAKCLNGVDDEYIRPRMRMPDLLDLYYAERVELAEKVDAGAMTPAEADLKLAQMKTEVISEDERRRNNATMAAAATMAATPGPTTCNTYGYGYGATTTCY